jgi:yecA family protein
MAALPEYHEIADVLGTAGAGGDASEAHGTLCGLLCGSSEDLPEAWIDNTLADAREDASDAPVDAHALLVRIYRATCESLGGDEMSFKLLLPGDSEAIESRLESLAAWAQGFLYGLAVRGLRELEDLDGKIREFLEDLVEISRVEADAGDDPESSEADYSALVEYVRVGVQLVFDQASATAPTGRHSGQLG